MNLFDTMYEEVLVPFFETLGGVAVTIIGWIIAIVMLITTPIWIIPYLIIRKIRRTSDKKEQEVDE